MCRCCIKLITMYRACVYTNNFRFCLFPGNTCAIAKCQLKATYVLTYLVTVCYCTNFTLKPHMLIFYRSVLCCDTMFSHYRLITQKLILN